MFSEGEDFAVEDHALLFGLIARAVIEKFGRQGEKVIESGVKEYGRERGRRKAKRVKADKEELNLVNYFAYKAWEVDPQLSVAKFEVEESKLNLKVHRCPWYEYWRENNLIEYADLYCQYIDSAIVEGYNQDLNLKLSADQSSGAEYCDFYFKAKEMTEQDLKLIASKRERVIEKAVKDWNYHTQHLYQIFKEVVFAELGSKGEEVFREVENEFKKERE